MSQAAVIDLEVIDFDVDMDLKGGFNVAPTLQKEPVRDGFIKRAFKALITPIFKVLDKTLELLRKIPLLGKLFGKWKITELFGKYSEKTWWGGLMQTIVQSGFRVLIGSFVDALQGSVRYYLSNGKAGETPESELRKNNPPPPAPTNTVFSSQQQTYPRPVTPAYKQPGFPSIDMETDAFSFPG